MENPLSKLFRVDFKGFPETIVVISDLFDLMLEHWHVVYYLQDRFLVSVKWLNLPNNVIITLFYLLRAEIPVVRLVYS